MRIVIDNEYHYWKRRRQIHGLIMYKKNENKDFIADSHCVID